MRDLMGDRKRTSAWRSLRIVKYVAPIPPKFAVQNQDSVTRLSLPLFDVHGRDGQAAEGSEDFKALPWTIGFTVKGAIFAVQFSSLVYDSGPGIHQLSSRP